MIKGHENWSEIIFQNDPIGLRGVMGVSKVISGNPKIHQLPGVPGYQITSQMKELVPLYNTSYRSMVQKPAQNRDRSVQSWQKNRSKFVSPIKFLWDLESTFEYNTWLQLVETNRMVYKKSQFDVSGYVQNFRKGCVWR